jgi:signal transduction histidine kinase
MLIQATQSFIFKERRLASLVWLWGVLGTLILFLLVDYLTTFTLLSRIPYFSDALLWLRPIYYFLTLFLCSRVYGLWFGSILSTFFQFIGQMAVLIIIMSFWGVYSIFMTTDYQENTFDLRQEAPSFFTEESKLEYPSDAELIHTSLRKRGANF